MPGLATPKARRSASQLASESRQLDREVSIRDLTPAEEAIEDGATLRFSGAVADFELVVE